MIFSFSIQGWKKKYVIMRQNTSSDGKSALLELYIEKDAHHKPVISKLLEKVDSITRLPSKTRDYSFEITSGEKNLLCVGCESEIEAFEWMEIFHQHLLEARKELAKLPEIEDGKHIYSMFVACLCLMSKFISWKSFLFTSNSVGLFT